MPRNHSVKESKIGAEHYFVRDRVKKRDFANEMGPGYFIGKRLSTMSPAAGRPSCGGILADN